MKTPEMNFEVRFVYRGEAKDVILRSCYTDVAEGCARAMCEYRGMRTEVHDLNAKEGETLTYYVEPATVEVPGFQTERMHNGQPYPNRATVNTYATEKSQSRWA